MARPVPGVPGPGGLMAREQPLPERVTLLGIRHHGPGSARMVVAALEAVRPEVVLIEGPPEGDALLPHVPRLTPPVALLLHDEADPARAAFWPFAGFSPEWRALTWAHEHDVPVRFFDLPAAASLADGPAPAAPAPPASPDSLPASPLPASPPPTSARPDSSDDAPAPGSPLPDSSALPAALPSDPPPALPSEPPPALPSEPSPALPSDPPGDVPAQEIQQEIQAALDPLGVLAEAAGFDDPERWWEDVVEHHTDPADLPGAVAEAMSALREEFADQVDARTLRREAAMRQNLRQALKDFPGPIAVVAGAWHVPALRTLPPAAVDLAALKGLPRRKISGTWVPWSHGRLAAASGYGAGVASPGWYAHLWECAERGDAVPRWFARACAVLRAEDLPASTASAVEAVRLADTLAALRGRPSPGLAEVMEAALAVLCGGDETPLRLVHDQLVISERLGEVGDGVPTSPLAADLTRLRRKLRMPPPDTRKAIRLDLRKDTDRERSKLLRRLDVLDVPWGTPDATRTLGTFAEAWQLHWQPEFAVSLAVAARHGTTVESAARQVLTTHADEATRVVDAAEVLSRAVGCEIPEAVTAARRALDRCAAAATDALELLTALPNLATTVRYGSVRGTDPDLLRVALHGLLARGAVGLPLACRGVDDNTAERALKAIDGAEDAVRLAADDEHRDTWQRALRSLVAMPDAHGLPTGRATRLLWETGVLDSDAVAARLHRAVSAGAAGAGRGRWAGSGAAGTGSTGMGSAGTGSTNSGSAGSGPAGAGSGSGSAGAGTAGSGLIGSGSAGFTGTGTGSISSTSGSGSTGATAFVAGFLRGSAALLTADPRLFGVVDEWLTGLPGADFEAALPLLRRAVTEFSPAERRMLGDRVRGTAAGSSAGPGGSGEWDEALAGRLVEHVRVLLAEVGG
ncbi:DUF5682 family protein [Saccharothrix lopnurensis]|uniref:DUF5682 family protein n=1 Tax=Saccharothrix lopnurensis TaxID=1670621 RepID=A0ABW1NZN0_9PSEU